VACSEDALGFDAFRFAVKILGLFAVTQTDRQDQVVSQADFVVREEREALRFERSTRRRLRVGR
jgi:hypothetical protein